MSVVEFPHRAAPAPGGWSNEELQRLIALSRANDESAEFAVGATEHGDPQFYLLGPAPGHDCILCVSRLAQTYVLEDGEGRLIGETPALDTFAIATARAAIRKTRSFAARAIAAWITVRLTIEERLEPIIEESEELLVRFGPQIVAFA